MNIHGLGVLGKYLWFESSDDCHHLCVKGEWADVLVLKSSPAQNIKQAMKSLLVEFTALFHEQIILSLM